LHDSKFKLSSEEDSSGGKNKKPRAKDNKTLKTKLVLILYLHHPKNAQTICFYFLCFITKIKVICFLPSFPCLTKPKHWTHGFWRPQAAKRGDRMFVSGSHYLAFLTNQYRGQQERNNII
jgi:hypothetical protein